MKHLFCLTLAALILGAPALARREGAKRELLAAIAERPITPR